MNKEWAQTPVGYSTSDLAPDRVAAEVPDGPRVEHAIARIENTIHRVGDVVATLEEKLSVVCVPPGPQASFPVVEGANVPVIDVLVMLDGRLREVGVRLESIVDRLRL